MDKKKLMNDVAATSGMSVKNASLAVNTLLHVITMSLQKKEPVAITGFGSFTVKDRPARLGRNPQTGESIKIAPRSVVTFKPGSGLKFAQKPAQKSVKKVAGKAVPKGSKK